MHAISLEEHNALLFEMGWKEEEFEVGFHKDIAASHFQQYAALVKSELAKGEVRGPDDAMGGGGVSPLPLLISRSLPCLGRCCPDTSSGCANTLAVPEICSLFSRAASQEPSDMTR